jgi:hypothetical protein
MAVAFEVDGNDGHFIEQDFLCLLEEFVAPLRIRLLASGIEKSAKFRIFPP